MSNIVNFIIFFLFMASFVLLIFRNFFLSYNISKIKKQLLVSELEKEIIKNKLTIENSESFVAFLEKSRQDAFSYIENVQIEINKFINNIKPEINYFKEYGDIGSMSPNYYSMKKITESFEELKKLLPEDYDRIE